MAGTRRIADLRAEHARVVQHLAGPQTPVHMLGIGGVGMAGVAVQLAARGYAVSGCDGAPEGLGPWLGQRGIPVAHGHHPDHLTPDTVWLVRSPAVSAQEPEVLAARARGLPIFLRGTVLPALLDGQLSMAVGGAHGKTTTSAMLAHVLRKAGHDVSFCIGGEVPTLGGVAHAGRAGLMVVEADESDGTFLKLPADIAIVTNVDPEHLDHFKTFEAVQDAFRQFVENVPYYGFAVMCIDHPVVQALVGRIEDRRIITYGENPQADVRLMNLTQANGASNFSVMLHDRKTGSNREMGPFTLPMPGRHNALNATSAIAVAHELGISDDAIRAALAKFGGVKRRFTRTGVWGGVTIIDDYGHHPVEIAAVLKAARESNAGRVIAVVQPHRYTRLQSLFDEFCTCFNDADVVIAADVYPAGEAPIPGIDRDSFVLGLRTHGHRRALPLENPAALAALVRDEAKPGDIVVCLGAGSITNWAYALPGELQALESRS